MFRKIFLLSLITIVALVYGPLAQEAGFDSDLPSEESRLTESVDSTSQALFPNPALLSLNRNQFISGSYGSIYDNAFQHLNLIYALRLKELGLTPVDIGVLGVSTRYDTTQGYDHAGIALAYGYELAGLLSLGGSAGLRGDTFLFPQFDLNIGILINPLKNLYLGLNFDDLIKLGRGNIGTSASYSLSSPSFLKEVNLSGQVRAIKGIDSFLKGGIEVGLVNENWVFPPAEMNLPIDIVGNRIGVVVDILDPDRYNVFNAGLGLRAGGLQADYNYRYSVHSRLNSHTVSLSYRFSTLVETPPTVGDPPSEGVVPSLGGTEEEAAQQALDSKEAQEMKEVKEEPSLRRRTIEDLSIKDETEPKVETGTARREIKVYSGPGDFYPVLVELQKGAKLSITGSFGKWYKAVTSEGEEGWVQKEGLVERDIIIAD